MSTDSLFDVSVHYNTIINKASPKQLRKFINALDDKCLKNMIGIYINSVIEQPNYNKMRPFQTRKKMEENLNENKKNPNQNILSLLDKYCKKKKKKKRNIYQKQSKLLSLLAMALMAHSLSYLQFNELSKCECVCLYFMNASRKYKAISHGYLDIDQQFLALAFTNRININLLSHFQNIKINAMHIGVHYYNGSEVNKTILYWKILTKLIKRSQQTLKSLIINASSYGWRSSHRYPPLKPIIERLLNEIDCFPSLITLNWGHDGATNTFIDDNYQQIHENIQSKCPLLQNLHIDNYLGSKHKIFFMENSVNLISKLKSLHLNYVCAVSQQLFNTNAIPLILRHCKQLQTLTIKCDLTSTINENIKKEFISINDLESNASIIINKYKMNFTNKALKTLNVIPIIIYEWDAPRNNNINVDYCHQLLIYFGLICINLEELLLDFRDFPYPEEDSKWLLIFDLINANKIKYDSQTQLKKISITQKNKKCIDDIVSGISNQLFAAKNFKYLEFFELKVIENIQSTKFNEIITKQLVPFLIKHENMGGNLKCMQFELKICLRDMDIDTVYEDYYKPIILLLNNVPKSLQKLTFNYGNGLNALKKNKKKYEKYSMEFVKCLVKLSADKQNNLEMIQFNGLCLDFSSQRFLQFYFGFNNNYFHENRNRTDYQLLFL